MKYLKVKWYHDHTDEPIEIFSEISDKGFEIRKVEVFRDGRMQFSDVHASFGDIFLSEKIIPSADIISKIREIEAEYIEEISFKEKWRSAIDKGEVKS